MATSIRTRHLALRLLAVLLLASGASAQIVADLTATPLSGDVPLTVSFTDTSTNGPATFWSWNHGDGGFSSGDPNPVHT